MSQHMTDEEKDKEFGQRVIDVVIKAIKDGQLDLPESRICNTIITVYKSKHEWRLLLGSFGMNQLLEEIKQELVNIPVTEYTIKPDNSIEAIVFNPKENT